MKSTVLRLMLLGFVFVLALTIVAGNSAAWGGKKADIIGKVEQGKIVTDDGKTYNLEDNAKAQDLMTNHMCHSVEVKGQVTERNGEDTIKVSSFKHLAAGKC